MVDWNRYPPWILIAGVFLFVVAFLAIMKVFFPSWVSVLSTSISLLLSALLVVLYYQQRRLIATQHEPLVQLKDYDFPQTVSEGGVKSNPIQDKIDIQLANKGNGIARGLNLRCDFYLNVGNEVKGSEELSLETDEEHFRLESLSQPLRRRDESGKLIPEAAIQVDEEVWFETNVMMMYYREEGGSSIRFREAVEKLSKAGFDRASFDLHLEYEDMIGRQQEKRILGKSIELRGETTLYEAIQEGTAYAGTLTILAPGYIAKLKRKTKTIWETLMQR